jgi:uncharacterized protein (DUF488 family)
MQSIFTVGYEGANVTDFIETLRVAGIETLVDVRELPMSRKPGFSKRVLAQHLEQAGITYTHIKALGDPKPGREAARAGNMPKFRRIFGAHLNTPNAQSALGDVVRLASASTVCLLCFEREHTCCHRAIVADALMDLGRFKLRHIGVCQGIASPKGANRAISVRELSLG